MLSELTEICSHQEDKSTCRDQKTTACLLDSESYFTLEEERTDPLPSQVPVHCDLESSYVDPDGSPSWLRIRTLLQQLPPQDSDERYCSTLGEEERVQLRLFSAHRRQQALGQGVIRLVPPTFEGHMCEKCGTNLRPGEPGVFAARAGESSCWHPGCFTCQACSQALLDLIYFYHKGHLYCGRHHAELLRPRCPACDQLIFSGRCTEAAGRRWHEDHFCCLDCTIPLNSGQYALPGSGPCCPRCFESRLDSDVDPSQPEGDTLAPEIRNHRISPPAVFKWWIPGIQRQKMKQSLLSRNSHCIWNYIYKEKYIQNKY